MFPNPVINDASENSVNVQCKKYKSEIKEINGNIENNLERKINVIQLLVVFDLSSSLLTYMQNKFSISHIIF